MPKYSKRHYRDVANTLRRTRASKSVVAGFVRDFQDDNPRFKKDVFYRYLNTGKERSQKKKRYTSRRKPAGLLKSLGF